MRAANLIIVAITKFISVFAALTYLSASAETEISRGQANSANSECIYFGNPTYTDGISKFEISEPGNYCLTEDLHARFEMADHRAEGAIIIIRCSNVVLDLQGHTIGRGRIFVNHGGVGIEIYDKYNMWKWISNSQNIVIKNGIIQDFNIGVNYNYGRWENHLDKPLKNRNNGYFFPQNQITLENITFLGNKSDFNVRIPNTTSPDNSEYENRLKSQYPPCGGTDYFGRPLQAGEPCNDGK